MMTRHRRVLSMLRPMTLTKNKRNLPTTTMTVEQEDNDGGCDACGCEPCVWAVNRADMVRADELVNEHLVGDIARVDARRRRYIYRQMSLIINEGPLGRNVRAQLPSCVVSGVRSVLPDPDGNYMGFMYA